MRMRPHVPAVLFCVFGLLSTSLGRVHPRRVPPRTWPLSLFVDLGRRGRVAAAAAASGGHTAGLGVGEPFRRPYPIQAITSTSLEPSFGSSILNNGYFQTAPPAEGDENNYQQIGGPAIRHGYGKAGPYAPLGGGRGDPLDVGWRNDKKQGPQASFLMTGLGAAGAGGEDKDVGHHLPGSKLPAAGSDYVDTWYPEVSGGGKYQVDTKDPGADVKSGEIADKDYPVGGHDTSRSMLNPYASAAGLAKNPNSKGGLGNVFPGTEVMGELPYIGPAPKRAGG